MKNCDSPNLPILRSQDLASCYKSCDEDQEYLEFYRQEGCGETTGCKTDCDDYFKDANQPSTIQSPPTRSVETKSIPELAPITSLVNKLFSGDLVNKDLQQAEEEPITWEQFAESFEASANGVCMLESCDPNKKIEEQIESPAPTVSPTELQNSVASSQQNIALPVQIDQPTGSQDCRSLEQYVSELEIRILATESKLAEMTIIADEYKALVDKYAKATDNVPAIAEKAVANKDEAAQAPAPASANEAAQASKPAEDKKGDVKTAPTRKPVRTTVKKETGLKGTMAF